MNTNTPTPAGTLTQLRHRIRRAVTSAAVAGALTAALATTATPAIAAAAAEGAVGASAASARAATETAQETRHGYAKPTDKWLYLNFYSASGMKILHVDTKHQTADGFWFAYHSTSHLGGDKTFRPAQWKFQPYGAWCANDLLSVGRNEWLNSPWCVQDDAGVEQQLPGYLAARDACRTRTGLPFMDTAYGSAECFPEGVNVDRNFMTLESPTANELCAPWEDQTIDPKTTWPRCMHSKDPWVTAPENWWTPAPDTCTGMPADTLRLKPYRNPVDHVPASGDGTCKGQDLPPNCQPDSNEPACGGTGTFVTASVTATATATRAAAASVTATRKATVHRKTVYRTASKRVDGRTVTARGSAKVRLTRSATVTVTASASVTMDATRTGTCSADTQAAAAACAAESAEAKAEQAAAAAAEAAAQQQAFSAANTQAAATAAAEATAAAKTDRIPDTVLSKAYRAAQRAAKENLVRKIAAMR